MGFDTAGLLREIDYLHDSFGTPETQDTQELPDMIGQHEYTDVASEAASVQEEISRSVNEADQRLTTLLSPQPEETPQPTDGEEPMRPDDAEAPDGTDALDAEQVQTALDEKIRDTRVVAEVGFDVFDGMGNFPGAIRLVRDRSGQLVTAEFEKDGYAIDIMGYLKDNGQMGAGFETRKEILQGVNMAVQGLINDLGRKIAANTTGRYVIGLGDSSSVSVGGDVETAVGYANKTASFYTDNTMAFDVTWSHNTDVVDAYVTAGYKLDHFGTEGVHDFVHTGFARAGIEVEMGNTVIDANVSGKLSSVQNNVSGAVEVSQYLGNGLSVGAGARGSYTYRIPVDQHSQSAKLYGTVAYEGQGGHVEVAGGYRTQQTNASQIGAWFFDASGGVAVGDIEVFLNTGIDQRSGGYVGGGLTIPVQ